ncbi:thioesterase family protein [Salininema proteolyticum]|uniref:Thioesterase family protein n=1 Tax=Salininema proteolyticum TaxID=1607685 RepID=A0ABV8U001_9ACTN
MSDAEAYFVRLGENAYRPTELTSGAWNPAEQHISPMNGLITHAVERYIAERGPDGMEIGRISIDILGVLPLDPFEITVDVVRPGRTIELLEATVVCGGRPAVRARIWRSSVNDTEAVAGGAAEALPAPETVEPWTDLAEAWPGGYIQSLELRPTAKPRPGRTTAWITSLADLVEGEKVSDLARLTGLVDTANGVAPRVSAKQWIYPNLDLTIHYFRRPSGQWLGLDTSVVFGPGGQGVTSTALHDADGHVGFAQQTLTIRPRS